MLKIGEDAEALPVRNREKIRVQAKLNRPAHVYLLWVDGQGVVTPLYPWQPWDDLENGHDLGAPPPQCPPRAEVISPPGTKGWPMEGKSGLETVLLLARPTPLPRDVKLDEIIRQMPPSKFTTDREWGLRGLDYGQPVDFLNPGENRGPQKHAEEIDDPLLKLMARLGQHFEVVRALRFAHQGD